MNSIRVWLNLIGSGMKFEKEVKDTDDMFKFVKILSSYININKVVYGSQDDFDFIQITRHEKTPRSDIVATQEQIEQDIVNAIQGHKTLSEQNWAVEVYKSEEGLVPFARLDRLEHDENLVKGDMKSTFMFSDGRKMSIFIKNNPWKLQPINRWQKTYRRCILCGTDRFTDEQWSNLLETTGSPTMCDEHPRTVQIGELYDSKREIFTFENCTDKQYEELKIKESFTTI